MPRGALLVAIEVTHPLGLQVVEGESLLQSTGEGFCHEPLPGAVERRLRDWLTPPLVDDVEAGHRLQTHSGFAYMYQQNGGNPPGGRSCSPYYGVGQGRGIFWHPDFAWAARREAIDHLGGLIDFAVLGSADHHMAMALIGQAPRTLNKGLSSNYRAQVMDWQDLAERHIQRDIGFVDGTLLHHWHGKKRDRRYTDRWQILVEHKFDPRTDLKRDWQGLWQLRVESPRQICLRDSVRAYFRSRNEDSIDVG